MDNGRYRGIKEIERCRATRTQTNPSLEGMPLLQRGQRLSVQPVLEHLQLFVKWAESIQNRFRGKFVTYSIIAKCPETGQYGVGIQSHFYGAGNAC